MEQSFGLFFFLKKQKSSENGDGHIYMRITIDGKSVDISTKRNCNKKDWNVKYQKLIGNDKATVLFNGYLDTMRQKVFEAKRGLLELDKDLTPENIKAVLLGKSIQRDLHMLMQEFKIHNQQMKSLIGKEFSEGTYERYETSYRHTESFLQTRYKVEDIDIRKLKYEFIEEYQYWLKTVRKCEHNSTIKYLSNFRKIVNLCVRRGWLDRDPFKAFKMTKKEVERTPLTESELLTIDAKQFASNRLALVRDIFLFSCYTGLAYIDIKKLLRSEIFIGVDGEKWIYSKRQKTDVPAKIPLLPAALKIMIKYDSNTYCQIKGFALPVLSNQKMNAYLKEIADLCGIHKILTFHIARHTFATTVTLSNGVPIETVSKMLGHRNLRTTQHYAKILDHKISDDMKKLREKYL